ncbi:hypothetical protein B0T26DRAFT_670653 [Lasiosphaeria miniovina]|uniref:Peptidase A2 domain-containing protein n=1 Tax=Lasiosphaeria miniovina TaxID=1954250 RepID=A0AA40EAF6_9PEZI|nr:uncharacterized protein B0T26DRAFT_670653 [Lasiosphaeria miniovina]KAK0734344.1 hypothetical protein B0T26DRAFT_670653 [Lasiosphaeria miniovina]
MADEIKVEKRDGYKAKEDELMEHEYHLGWAARTSTSDETPRTSLPMPGTIIDVRPAPVEDRNGVHRNSYYKVNAKAIADGLLTSVCLDAGCSTVMADQQWITRNYPGAPVINIGTPRGIDVAGGGQITVNKMVKIDFYLPGLVKGVEGTGKFPVEALLTTNLKPNMLLGTSFLARNGAKLDYSTKTTSFASYQDLVMPFEAVRKSPKINRRIISTKRIVIPPKSFQVIEVDYKPLP